MSLLRLTAQATAAVLLALGVTACGSLGGENGGDSNLPNRGIIPYAEPANEDPDDESPADPAISVEDGYLRAPHADAIDDGTGDVEMYAEWVDSEGLSHIVRATSSDDGRSFTSPVVVFGAGDGDILGEVQPRSPAALQVDGVTHIVFELGEGLGIGHATVDAAGVVTVSPTPLMTPGASFDRVAAPSLALNDGVYWLVFEAQSGEEPARILRATAGADLQFGDASTLLAPVISNDDDVIDVSWEEDGVGEPELRIATDANGRTVYRLMYVGRSGANLQIGFAASFDGDTFERFDFNPLFSTIRDGNPSNVSLDDRYLLYVERRSNRASERGIDVYLNTDGAPSERF